MCARFISCMGEFFTWIGSGGREKDGTPSSGFVGTLNKTQLIAYTLAKVDESIANSSQYKNQETLHLLRRFV